MTVSERRGVRRDKPIKRRAGGRRTALPDRVAGDLLALLGLALLLGGLLLAAALRPPTGLAFAVDEPPSGVVLRNFYGVERNAAGPFRWAKPDAALTLPVAAPATYRVTLTLGDSPAIPAPRGATIYINGAVADKIVLEGIPRDYIVEHRLEPRVWATGGRALQVEMQTAPFVPPGDPRALGPLVARLAVAPVPASAPLPLGLFALYLPLLALGYGALRARRISVRAAAVALGLPLALLAAAALVARPALLSLLYQPLYRPLWLLGAALFLSPLPFVARAWPVRGVRGAGRRAAGEEGSGAVAGHELPLPAMPRAPHPALLPAAVVALACGLRLYRYNALSLWVDEGYTILFSRLSWPAVLGLQGRYDLKPPLYFAAVKLVSTVVPEVSAGRLLSVLAGTATVGVVYALAARLAGRAVALCAGLILAVSPLHIWYSQEARMYALSTLLVALSYLALIAFHQSGVGSRQSAVASPPPSPRVPHWWAGLYGVAVLAALYVDYSVAYALAPQVFLLALIVKAQGRRTLPVVVATAGAALGFLLWAPQVLSAMGQAGNALAGFLSVTPAAIGRSLLAIAGLSSGVSDYWGPARAPWVAWPALRGILVLPVALAAASGAVALGGRRVFGSEAFGGRAFDRTPLLAPVVVAALLAGTIGAATLISLVSPGYADRTVLYAVLGWAVLAGAAPFVAAPRWLRAAGMLAVVAIVTLSVLSLAAVYRGADKQHYRDLAAAAATAATFDLPIVTNDPATEALIDAYQPRALDTRHIRMTGKPLAALLAQQVERGVDTDALWYAYGDYSWIDVAGLREQLSALGYERVMHRQFPYPVPGPLYLDLYARPDARLGAPVPLDDRFAADSARDGAASTDVPLPAAAPSLVTLAFEAQAPPAGGSAAASLSCLAASGAPLQPASEGEGAPIPGDGAWRVRRLATLCPAGTAAVRIAVRTEGGGMVSFRHLRLWQATPQAEPTAKPRAATWPGAPITLAHRGALRRDST